LGGIDHVEIKPIPEQNKTLCGSADDVDQCIREKLEDIELIILGVFFLDRGEAAE